MNSANEEEVVRSTVDIKDVKRRRILYILGLVFLLCLVGGGSAAISSYLTVRDSAQDGTALAQQIQQACDSDGATSSDLQQFCPKADQVVESAPSEVKSTPVPGPPGPSGPAGKDGEDGSPPNDSQVLNAVRSFCIDTGKCKGEDGSDATPAQVAVAVSSYCNSRGQCRGPAGTDGQNGSDGQDAPPITQNQIVEAVDTYCSNHDNCRGPQGDTGKDGQDGDTGPAGVVNVVDNCDAAPENMVIADVDASYNSGTQTVTISCTYKEDQQGGLVPGTP